MIPFLAITPPARLKPTNVMRRTFLDLANNKNLSNQAKSLIALASSSGLRGYIKTRSYDMKATTPPGPKSVS